MNVNFVRCEIFDGKHWNVIQRCNKVIKTMLSQVLNGSTSRTSPKSINNTILFSRLHDDGCDCMQIGPFKLIFKKTLAICRNARFQYAMVHFVPE